jgi:glycolate oxidase iron-sulfur subunit
MIATANIGCQLHLDAGSDLSVVHWLELIDPDGMRP